MTERTYSFKELADMFGMAPKPFKAFMIEMGFLDQDGRVTDLALQNGFLVERLTPHKEE